ncbi:MAG: putative ABC transport system permease protein [Paraglaciecola sp.]|jgi:putative ABC transport system permease protein
MLQNYFKMAIRQILKHKLFSVFNIFGLATSMAVCLLVIMILMDSYGYDKFHENSDCIYRVISANDAKETPLHEPTMATTSLDLADDLKTEFPFVEKTTRIAGCNGIFFIAEKKVESEEGGYMVGEDFFKIFTFGWLSGNENNALRAPRSIVVTDEFAKNLFPYADALGKTVKFEDLGDFTITGIVPKTPLRSHLKFDFLLSYATFEILTDKQKAATEIGDFDNIWRGLVYVLLKENTSENEFAAALNTMAAKYSDRHEVSHFLFQPQALNAVMPSMDLNNEIGIGTPRIVLFFILSLGIIIILAACFNYMNLSLARSIKRSKEIGIRKVAGARRKDIIFQFLGESILISLFSLLLAMVMLEFLIPAFYGIDPFVETAFFLEKSPLMYVYFFFFAIVIGFFAGVFPAFNISKFQPIQAINQLSNLKVFSKIGLRKALVVGQFALSLIFILVVLLVLKQQDHVLNADIGVNSKNIKNVWMQGEDYDVFIQQIKQINGVESVASSQDPLLLGSSRSTNIKFNAAKDSMEVTFNNVSANYLEFMEVELLAGNYFPENSDSENEQFIILNEKAANRMGYENPNEALGQTVKIDTNLLSVIGVTKNFHHNNIWFDEISPYAFRQGENYKNCVSIRLSEANLKEINSDIYDTWTALSPEKSISSNFTDTRVYFLAKFFRMGSKIMGFVGFLTILISCLGLLGMVIYTIEGRLKEVGIRKILGASESNIHWILAKGFLLLLGIAVLIAVPIVFFVGNLWLQNFVLRTSINLWMLLVGIGIIFTLAMLTVFSQTMVAARTNPVNVLKND